MNKALILLNGDLSDLSNLKSYVDAKTLKVACDGGLKNFNKLGLKPDVIIGDFDSISEIPKDIKVIKYPPDKDFTDSDLCIAYAKKLGIKNIIISGFLGDRVDHMLGNIFLLERYKDLKIKIVDNNQEIYLIEGSNKIKGKPGQTISFMPIFGAVEVVSSRGLKYDPSKYKMSMNSNSGISNEFVHPEAEINIKNGKLLVVHNLNGVADGA